jgi:UPF0716 family protein affecting phage T7 exclusion
MARLTPQTAREWVAWLSPGTMIIVGGVLFFIPVPPTSLIGVSLIILGSVFWLVDYFGGEEGVGTGRTSGGAGYEEGNVEAE